MTQVSEITERGSQELAKQSRLGWGLTVAKTLLRNPGVLKNLKMLVVMGPDEPRYVRPPREYEIPPFHESMKHRTSDEKYLRPTRWCNPREPEVIAMANELGAYELSDYEFADAAYWFVKTKLVGEMVPMDSVSATLNRGTGTCFHLISLWIALCRAAGIKARYKMFKAMMNEVVVGLDMTEMLGLGETEQEMLPDILNTAIGHGAGEACIDGKWVVADVGLRPEMEAHAGAPISKLGEDPMWKLVPGTIERLESLSLMRGITMRVQSWLAPVVMERADVMLAGLSAQGRKIIDEAGGIEAYDLNARRRRELFATDEITRQIKEAARPQFVEFKE